MFASVPLETINLSNYLVPFLPPKCNVATYAPLGEELLFTVEPQNENL